jgi:hypothetical protein
MSILRRWSRNRPFNQSLESSVASPRFEPSEVLPARRR